MKTVKLSLEFQQNVTAIGAFVTKKLFTEFNLLL